jgi:aubergine-like protein
LIRFDFFLKGSKNVKEDAEKLLLGESVLTRYNNKTYKIDEIDFAASPRDSFTNERGEKLTYIEYYANQYNIQIKDPDQVTN